MNSKTPWLPHQRGLLFAAVLSVLVTMVPMLRAVVLPLTYLNTHLHELSHALAATFTGGQAQEIVVRSDGSGVTPISGGSIWIIGPAGYLGAALIGAGMIYVGRSADRARLVLRVLALVLAASMVLWVRGDLIGFLSGLFWTGALGTASFLLKGNPVRFVCQFLGVEQCINAFTSVYDLVKISAFTERQSDAVLMQNATHLPAVLWATSWCLASAALMWVTVRSSWSRPTSGPAESPAPGR